MQDDGGRGSGATAAVPKMKEVVNAASAAAKATTAAQATAPKGSGSWYTKGNGWEYHGEFMDDSGARLRHGFGIEKNPNGEIYSGFWNRDRRHGRGVWTAIDEMGGSWRYEGDFADDVIEGVGVQTFPDGSLYAGEWQGGRQNGHGSWSEPSGVTYHGEFRNNMRHGYGAEKHRDKADDEAKEGEWRCDLFVTAEPSRAVIASAIAKNASREAMDAAAEARKECQRTEDAFMSDSDEESMGEDEGKEGEHGGTESSHLLVDFNRQGSNAPDLPEWITAMCSDLPNPPTQDDHARKRRSIVDGIRTLSMDAGMTSRNSA
eukprot:scaffold935_cov248-Pinguiococcus_pyrenoidosus.AAC.17